MSQMRRRLFLGAVTAGSLAALFRRATPTEFVVEAPAASTFFAPYCVDRLVSGCPLDVDIRKSGTYLALDGRAMAEMPRGLHGGKTVRVLVERTELDSDGRLRLFVRASE